MLKLKIDTSDLDRVLKNIANQTDKIEQKALMDMADELLRISTAEVPHDQGILQASGTVQPDGTDVIVGYHTPYAARLHEHPEYRFQKGRKGKYLEDPLKHNLTKWLQVYYKGLEELFK